MKLDIVVPHYKEPDEIVKPLLDSIAIQQGIDLNDLRVILVEDGQEGVSDAFFESYSFPKVHLRMPHGGVSATRNAGLDYSDAEYVMFCDCDDMFLNVYGMHMVFGAMNEGFDMMSSVFIEEQKTKDGYTIIRHESKDITFMHGKVYRREFLVDKGLRFRDELTIHEDGYFNALCNIECSEMAHKYVEAPFYLWKWHDGSVCRRDNFILNTYPQLMKVRSAIVNDYIQRGFIHEANMAAIQTIIDTYYDFQKPDFLKEGNKTKEALRAFKEFYKEHGSKYKEANIKSISETMMVCRAKAYTNGMRVEQETIREFLNRATK